MLYIFHLDKGTMLTFDLSFRNGLVSELQVEIEKCTEAAVASQTLLISGGEILDGNKKILSYSAGTDTNPIYLVTNSGTSSDSTAGQSPAIPNEDTLRDLEASLASIKQTNITIEAVQHASSLANATADISSDYVDYCAALVSDHHHIHQGWLAVIVYVDEVLKIYSERVNQFLQKYEKHLLRRHEMFPVLDGLCQDLDLLNQIPLLPCLTSKQHMVEGAVIFEEPESSTITGIEEGEQTLLAWIKSKDTTHDLSDVGREARSLLEKFGPEVSNRLRSQLEYIQREGNQQHMKTIKGFRKRLDHLNDYLSRSKTHLDNQRALQECIVNLEQRVVASQDVSIVQDAGRKQIEQLSLMISVHCKSLLDISKRFCTAKSELLENLQYRLEWVRCVERKISGADDELILCKEQLRRLRRTLDVLHQIHDAPTVYAAAVAEVVRRRAFCSQFCDWAQALSKQVYQLYEREKGLRQTMSHKLKTHFLRQLFPGMQDSLPSFASRPPEPFDKLLPPLTPEHVRFLRNAVPKLSGTLKVCETNVLEQVSLKTHQGKDVVDRAGSATLERKPSFFTHTPPNVQFAKSFPSSSYISGDENLLTLGGDSRGSGDVFELESSGGVLFRTGSDAALAKHASADSLNDDLPPLPPLPPIGIKSAPISIPGNNSSAPSTGNNGVMTTSRQMSERSSRFGTPEEDIEESGATLAGNIKREVESLKLESNSPSLNTLDSPPEIISRSQISAEMLQVSSASPEKQTAPQIVKAGTRVSPQKFETAFQEEDAKKVEVELEKLKSSLALKETERLKVENVLAQIRSAIVSASGGLRTDMAGLREIIECHARNEAWMQGCANVISSFSAAQNARDESQKLKLEELVVANSKLENDLATMREENESLSMDKEKAESERIRLEAVCAAKCTEIEELNKLLALKEAEKVDECERAKAELLKQLSLDNELEMEALREQFKVDLNEKEKTVESMQNQLCKRDERLENVKKSCQLAREELDLLRTDASEHTKLDFSTIEEHLLALTSAHDERMAEITAANESKCSSLETALVEKDALIASLEGQLSNLGAKSEIEKVDAATDAEVVGQGDFEIRSPDFEVGVEESPIREESPQQTSPDDEKVFEVPAVDSNKSQSADDSPTEPERLGGMSSSSSQEASVIYSLSRSDYCETGELEQSTFFKESSGAETTDSVPVTAGSPTGGGGGSKSGEKRYLISIVGMREGEYVLAMYSTQHENYIACCLSKTAHFVTVQDVQDLKQRQKYQCTVQDRLLLGRVKQKEYCLAKKENNRFLLPKVGIDRKLVR